MANAKPPTRPTPRGGQRPLGARPSSSLWYGLAFLLLLGLAQLYYMAPSGRSIPYSEFKSLVKSNQLEEVVIGEQIIRGTTKQPASDDPKQSKQFTTTRVDDPKLTEELDANGVKYTGEMVNRWLTDLLG